MIGILILILGLQYYYHENRKFGALIFISEALNYFNIIPPSLTWLAGYDWAFVQMVILLLFPPRGYEDYYQDDFKLKKYLKWYALFLVCAIIYSVIHLRVSPFSALAGCRQYLLFPSYFFLRKLNNEEFEWVMEKLFFIAFFQSVLYIIEVTTGLPVMGTETIERDPLTGKFRYLNGNPLCQFFLYLAILFPNYYSEKKYNRYAIIVFLGAMLCTLVRTNIIITLLVLFLGLHKQGRGSNYVKVGIALCILYIPFGSAIESRFGGHSGTTSDLSAIIHGDFIDMAHTGAPLGENQTMTYRFAWVYERGEYMLKSSLGETIFGLGHEYDPNSLSGRYNFQIGLPKDNGVIEPKFTPDIAYGNLLANLGFVGIVIFMMIWFRMLRINMRNWASNPWAFIGALFILNLLGTSLSGTKLSSIGFLIFMLFLTANTVNNSYDSNTY